MVQDPKARAKMAEFHEVYALQGEGTRWSEASHDPALFPACKTTTVPMLTAEAKRFFDYITFDLKGTFQDLMTKPVAFVNRDLAPIYGLAAASYGTDLTMVNLEPDAARGRVHAGRLPGVVFVVQPHVAHPPRRVHREGGAVPADRRAAAGSHGRTAAAVTADLNTNREQVERADVGRQLHRLPRAGRQPGRLRAGGVRQHRGLADDGEGQRRRHRHARPTSPSARRSCTSRARST